MELLLFLRLFGRLRLKCAVGQQAHKTLRRRPVESTSIAAVGYEPESSTLEVEFRDGRVYRLCGVPEFLYQGLMLAGSKGKFFNTRLHGRYREELANGSD